MMFNRPSCSNEPGSSTVAVPFQLLPTKTARRTSPSGCCSPVAAAGPPPSTASGATSADTTAIAAVRAFISTTSSGCGLGVPTNGSTGGLCRRFGRVVGGEGVTGPEGEAMYGDTAVIRRRVSQLREQGTDIRALADQLVGQAEQVTWRGRAADAMRERVRDRAAQLRDCAGRHEGAADALER